MYIIKRNSSLSWPYLWTDFETKATYGLPLTQGWLEIHKISKFQKRYFNNFWKIWKFPSFNAFSLIDASSLLECSFPPLMPLPSLNTSWNLKGKKRAAEGSPEASTSKESIIHVKFIFKQKKYNLLYEKFKKSNISEFLSK